MPFGWAAAATVAAGAMQADAARDAAKGQQAAADRSAQAQQEAANKAEVGWDDAFNNSLAAQRSALDQYLPMQERAYQQALAEQQAARDRLYTDSAGYRDAGTNALQQLMAMLNQGAAPTMQDVQNEPGYQFGLQQGKNALEGSAAAKGGLYSGQALKELNQYGNDYASTKYNDAWNRTQQDYSNRWSRISGLVNMGQQENARVSSADQAYANNIGSLAQNNAQRQGSALLDQAGNETALRTNRASALGNLATGTANNLSNIWQNNSNAQGAAALQQGQIYGNGINQLAGLAYGANNGWFGGNQSTTANNVATANRSSDPLGTLMALQGNSYSDRRLKTGIDRVGTRPDGLGVYRFRYVWGGPERVGLIAQEVQSVYPDAVREGAGGFLMIDYSKV